MGKYDTKILLQIVQIINLTGMRDSIIIWQKHTKRVQTVLKVFAWEKHGHKSLLNHLNKRKILSKLGRQWLTLCLSKQFKICLPSKRRMKMKNVIFRNAFGILASYVLSVAQLVTELWDICHSDALCTEQSIVIHNPT